MSDKEMKIVLKVVKQYHSAVHQAGYPARFLQIVLGLSHGTRSPELQAGCGDDC